MPRIRNFRWWIIVLVFLAAVLNYVDRQTLSTLAPVIQPDLGMDDHAYSNVVNIFLIAYTIAYLLAGGIVDRLGTRVSMALFVGWWSIANALTAAASSVFSLGVYRFLLGLGEAGVWPAASKSVAEWFPARERALAIGLYTTGATVGATLAPYIVIPLSTYNFAESLPTVAEFLGRGAGWRIAFLLTGIAGIVWLLPWLWFYRSPKDSRYTTTDEITLLEHSAAEESRAGGGALNESWSWRQIFTSKVVWLLLLGRLITDPAWYFFQFWFPKYLHSVRGLSQEQLTITWWVYAAAGAGSLLGGLFSGVLVQRKISAAKSRLWIMLACACIMPLSIAIARAPTVFGAMAVAVVVVFASLAWLINISSLVVDLVPRACLGTVFGVIAAGSTLGGIIMNTLVAAMVSGPAVASPGFLDRVIGVLLGPIVQAVGGAGYSQWFLIMACLHPVAWLLLWQLRPRKSSSATAP